MTVAILLVLAGILVVVGVLVIAYKLVNRLPHDHDGRNDRGGTC